jgi:hemoglobin-like flavoprotein
MRASFWQPEVQQEKIYVISSQFFRRGMRATHIPMFGEALRGAVAQAVGKAFGDKLEASWDWFWRDLSAWLVRDLESLEAGNAEVVVHHWAQVQDTYAVEKLGEIFWKHVNEEAPEQTHIYKLPLKMWGHLLKHIINMLLLSVSEPERFYEELFALVIRHIRYGVRAEFLTPMGRAIFSVLGDCLGDQWDDRARACWSEVLRRPLLRASIDRSLEYLYRHHRYTAASRRPWRAASTSAGAPSPTDWSRVT